METAPCPKCQSTESPRSAGDVCPGCGILPERIHPKAFHELRWDDGFSPSAIHAVEIERLWRKTRAAFQHIPLHANVFECARKSGLSGEIWQRYVACRDEPGCQEIADYVSGWYIAYWTSRREAVLPQFSSSQALLRPALLGICFALITAGTLYFQWSQFLK